MLDSGMELYVCRNYSWNGDWVGNGLYAMAFQCKCQCFHFNILAEFTWNCDVFVHVVDMLENNHKAINNMIVQRNMQNVSMERKMYEKNYSNRYNFYEKQ